MSGNRWVRRALRVYPRTWRTRYGAEVLDLSDELMEHDGTHQYRVVVGLLANVPRIWFLALRQAATPRRLAVAIAIASSGFLAVLSVVLAPVNPAASAPVRVISGSMAPTIRMNQIVQVTRLGDGAKVSIGEIVIMHTPPQETCGGVASGTKYIVKRIVALPGQTLSLTAGRVLVNGRVLPEPWLPSSMRKDTYPGPGSAAWSLTHPYRVPSGDYYVLGDNRVDSCDSRYWGPVARTLLYGVVRTRS